MARNPPAGPPGEIGRRAARSRFILVAAVLAALVILGGRCAFPGAGASRQTPGGAAGTVLASAIGGSFRLTDQKRQDGHRC